MQLILVNADAGAMGLKLFVYFLENSNVVVFHFNYPAVCEDLRQVVFPTVLKYYLIVREVETDRKKVIYKGKYGESGMNSLVW